MNESYLIINGKRIDLTPEQLATLGIETPKKSPFDRVEQGKKFYYISAEGVVGHTYDSGSAIFDMMFDAANYCTDREVLKQRALHETLNRRLWRYSMEHDGDKINWDDGSSKYSIYMSHEKNEICLTHMKVYHQCIEQYFYTEEAAKGAVEEIVKPFLEEHPEFKL